jgi:hypothetical protein
MLKNSFSDRVARRRRRRAFLMDMWIENVMETFLVLL